MSYRGLNSGRLRAQVDSITRDVGFTGTWRKYVSATTGVPEMGLNASAFYAERIITAQLGRFGAPNSPEQQSPAGMIAAGAFDIITREKLERQDEFIWRGTAYRVEGDSIPSPLNNTFITRVKRGT